MNEELSFEENARLAEERKRTLAENKQKMDFEDLRGKIEISIKTTMIGDLDDIEQIFGYLWGHNKNGNLTETEKAMAKKWEQLRQSILDRGNGAIKKASYHLGRFTVESKVPSYKKFTLGKRNEE
jgi:hypothetical protein